MYHFFNLNFNDLYTNWLPEKVAVKMLDKGKLDHKTQKLLYREIEAMEEVHHPNILRLYEVIETLSTQYFVIEYASGT